MLYFVRSFLSCMFNSCLYYFSEDGEFSKDEFCTFVEKHIPLKTKDQLDKVCNLCYRSTSEVSKRWPGNTEYSITPDTLFVQYKVFCVFIKPNNFYQAISVYDTFKYYTSFRQIIKIPTWCNWNFLDTYVYTGSPGSPLVRLSSTCLHI